MSTANTEKILSVGIDIGTTSTQLVVSRLTIRNTAPGSAIPRLEIADKEILHQSPIHFTPLKARHLIDESGVSRIVDGEYRAAGIQAEDVRTGAVIITGETAKKENAQAILTSLAHYAGDFVVATAGANLESIIAGKGSGAAAYSTDRHRITVNVDVGGGTCNIGVFREGRAIDTACLSIGGRLIQLETGGDRIVWLAEPAARALKHCGLSLREGDRASLAQLGTVARAMAQCIKDVLTRLDLPPMARDLLTTKSLTLAYDISTVMFSGGVADYVYRDYQIRTVSDVSVYGDMGPLLGQAIKETFAGGPFALVAPAETIRATVIGAGAQSVSLSGSTITVDNETLPMRNVPVLRLFSNGVPASPEAIAREVSEILERGQDYSGHRTVALAFPGPATMSYPDICALADGLLAGLQDAIAHGIPVVTVTKSDCAKVLGQTLAARLGGRAAIVSLDQISVDEGDFIDIGKPLLGGRVVPVIVKTLVFENKACMEG